MWILLSNKLLVVDKGTYKERSFFEKPLTQFIFVFSVCLPTTCMQENAPLMKLKQILKIVWRSEDNPALMEMEECACENNNNAEGYQADFESCSDQENGLDSTGQSYCYMNNA